MWVEIHQLMQAFKGLPRPISKSRTVKAKAIDLGQMAKPRTIVKAKAKNVMRQGQDQGPPSRPKPKT